MLKRYKNLNFEFETLNFSVAVSVSVFSKKTGIQNPKLETLNSELYTSVTIAIFNLSICSGFPKTKSWSLRERII